MDSLMLTIAEILTTGSQHQDVSFYFKVDLSGGSEAGMHNYFYDQGGICSQE